MKHSTSLTILVGTLLIFAKTATAEGFGSIQPVAGITTSIPLVEMVTGESVRTVTPSVPLAHPSAVDEGEKRPAGTFKMIALRGSSRLFKAFELSGNVSRLLKNPGASIEFTARW